MTPLIHNYSHLAGNTVYWDTSDNEETYLKNLQDPGLKQRLQDLGFVDCKIEYQFNSHGFRTAEFQGPVDIVCFGCSYTMGTGVHAWQTWPSQLADITGMNVVNLGHAGSSNDTAFRFANHYLKWLKPKYAVWSQTDMHRMEIIDTSVPVSINIISTDTKNPINNDVFVKTWLTSDINQYLNLEKNTRAFRHLCTELDIQCVIMSRRHFVTDQTARDLQHPGVADYARQAAKVHTMLLT
jgi:hypothetical protein